MIALSNGLAKELLRKQLLGCQTIGRMRLSRNQNPDCKWREMTEHTRSVPAKVGSRKH